MKFLQAVGLSNLWGVDLRLNVTDRLYQGLAMWQQRSWRAPFHLRQGNLEATRFGTGRFDLAVCLSVIEHGVDLGRFLAEVSRILKPTGKLFITTDYWEEPLAIEQSKQPFRLPWKIFCRTEIETFLEQSLGFGFVPVENSTIPACSDKPVVWNGQAYTLMSITLKKVSGVGPCAD